MENRMPAFGLKLNGQRIVLEVEYGGDEMEVPVSTTRSEFCSEDVIVKVPLGDLTPEGLRAIFEKGVKRMLMDGLSAKTWDGGEAAVRAFAERKVAGLCGVEPLNLQVGDPFLGILRGFVVKSLKQNGVKPAMANKLARGSSDAIWADAEEILGRPIADATQLAVNNHAHTVADLQKADLEVTL